MIGRIGNDGVTYGSDDALEYASDTVDDGHEARADGSEHASNL